MPTYVQHAVLERIPDVFNAEAIWQAPGFALFSRRPLLRDLLERSPRELRGRAATRCFSHIQLRLPQEDVDDDYHLTRGARARELAQVLATLHQKDFGDLLGSDQVRYDVAGDDGLAPGEIAIRFGHAVYLPAPGEKALFNVAASRDGALWKPACAVYPGQRLALLGGAGLAVPGWPFGDSGAVLLVNDGPDSEPVLQMRPKDAFHCVFDASLGAYAISAKGADSPRLLLKIARSAGQAVTRGATDPARPSSDRTPPAAAASAPARAAALSSASPAPAVWQTRHATEQDAASVHAMLRAPAPALATGADDATAMPCAPRHPAGDATFAPGAVSRLTLVALALPRLSLYGSTGANTLSIPFTPRLGIAHHADAERALTIVIGRDDSMHALSAQGRQSLTAPARLELPGGQSLQLLQPPQALAERCLALLPLPQPVALPLLPGGALDFGRGQTALSALRVLDQPWMLEAAAPASPDRLGLSRRAFSCSAEARALSVQRLSATQTLYVLDEQMRPLKALDEAPVKLRPGQHLAAGHYILRFEA